MTSSLHLKYEVTLKPTNPPEDSIVTGESYMEIPTLDEALLRVVEYTKPFVLPEGLPECFVRIFSSM
jgi:hypothetical protein